VTAGANDRLLIVTGDDFGLSSAINGAILAAHRRGILTSASLLVNEGGFDEAVALARATPGLAVGLHLALSLSRSALPPREIPGLVDPQGRFLDSPVRAGWKYYFLRSAALQIEKEVRAQVEKFLSTGLRFDHLDGHQHLHLHPTVFPVVARVCAEYGIPAVRIVRDPFLANVRISPWRILPMAALSATYTLLGRRARRILRDVPVRAADRVLELLQDGRMAGPVLRALLASLPGGVTEIYCHPTLENPDGSGHHGRREYDALVDGETVRLIEGAGIRRVSYSDLPAAPAWMPERAVFVRADAPPGETGSPETESTL
jgi:hopanoid biosynthesis associated protein HpnK